MLMYYYHFIIILIWIIMISPYDNVHYIMIIILESLLSWLWSLSHCDDTDYYVHWFTQWSICRPNGTWAIGFITRTYVYMEVSINGGISLNGMVYKWKSIYKWMIWVYPNLRKPPHTNHILCTIMYACVYIVPREILFFQRGPYDDHRSGSRTPIPDRRERAPGSASREYSAEPGCAGFAILRCATKSNLELVSTCFSLLLLYNIMYICYSLVIISVYYNILSTYNMSKPFINHKLIHIYIITIL
jgi:hypothetical protein